MGRSKPRLRVRNEPRYAPDNVLDWADGADEGLEDSDRLLLALALLEQLRAVVTCARVGILILLARHSMKVDEDAESVHISPANRPLDA